MPPVEFRRIRGGVLSLGDAFILALGVGGGLWVGGVLVLLTYFGLAARAGFAQGLSEAQAEEAYRAELRETYEENTRSGGEPRP